MTDSLSIRHAQALPAVLPNGQQLEVINQVFDHCARQVTFDRNQLQQLERYLKFTGGDWAGVMVGDWLESLEGATDRSKATYLAQLRGAYRRVMKWWEFKPMLVGVIGDIARAALYMETITSLLQSLTLDITSEQDRDNSRIMWLTAKEVKWLVAAPYNSDLQPIIQARDSLMSYLAVYFGLRAAEVTALTADEVLLPRFGDSTTPAVKVRRGKGNKGRLIPMSNPRFADLRERVTGYLALTGLPQDGPLFWHVNQHGQLEAPLRFTAFGMHILPRYPLIRGGVEYLIRPHNLRRTCAQLWLEAGMSLLDISRNLGHSNTQVTERYLKIMTEGRIVK